MYSAKINGEPTTFGTSGLLYRSNKVMYDRKTESLWHQFTGEPIIGPLADSGIRLDFFPVEVTTWEEWAETHPATTVLSADTGLYRAGFYVPEGDPRAIYNSYFSSPETMFPVPFRDDSLATKDVVLGVGIGGHYKAYAVAALQRDRIVNDVLGDTEIVVLASAFSQAARVYLRDGRRFGFAEDGPGPSVLPEKLRDAAGVVWNVTEESLVSTADSTETLARVPAGMSFWFGWRQFHQDTELYDGGP